MTPMRRAASALTDARQAYAYARATARLLASGSVLACASACVVLAAAFALATSPQTGGVGELRLWGLWAVVGAGLPAAWYAWRVRLDEGLFVDLAQAIATQPSSNAALADLDAALAALGLSAVNETALRPLQNRGAGARRLVILQAAIAIGQALGLLALLLPVVS